MKRITFSIGQGKTKHGTPIENLPTLWPKAYLRLAEVYGGYTAKFCYGGWIDPEGELIQETSLVLEVVTDIDDSHEIVAGYLGEIFEQSCVLVTVENLESARFI